MKQIILICVCCMVVLLPATAQETATAQAGASAASSPELRKKYFNIGFVNQKLKPKSNYYFDTDQALKSNFGASLTVGRTYFLHKEPIARMIRFGIDATWFDLNYTNYKLQYKYTGSDYGGYYEEDEETYSYHQADIAMQVGPSISINPIDKLNVHAYFRYAPSFSILYADSFFGSYASHFVTGAAIYYNWIGLGMEARFGNANLKEFGGSSEDSGDYYGGDYYGEGSSSSYKLKSKFSGFRVYVTFRF